MSQRAANRSLIGVLIAVLVSIVAADVAAAQTPGEGEGVQGTIQYAPEDAEGRERLPVEGAEVVVYTATLSADGRAIEEVGEEVARGSSGADGTFSIDVPGPGDYAVELQTDTLPEGVTLDNEDRQQLAQRLTSNQRRTVLFALSEGEGGGGGRERDSRFDRGARLFFDGIKFGLIIGMCAIGLSLIYGTTGLVNFAHSEMITMGAVLGFLFNVTVGIPLIPATLVAMLLGGLLSAGFDLGIWRPLRRRGTGLVSMMIISVGVAIVLRYMILFQFGDRARPYDDYAVQTDPLFTLGPVRFIPKDVVIMIASIVVLLAVAAMLRLTKLGKAMRAVSDNPDLAASSGIDVNRVITLVWFLAGVLVTLGGIFQGLSEQISWDMGFQILLLVFAAVTLGGLGTDFGVIVGSLIVGVFVYVTTLVIPPELKNVGALVVLILILMVRPQGIFGRKERIG